MGSSQAEGGAFEVVVAATTDRFDADDDRWQAQVSDLVTGLGSEVGGVRRVTTPVEGTKGGIDTIILALGSAGTFTAAVEFFRAWLSRDKSRGLEISWSDGDRTQTVSVSGEAIDEGSMRILAEAAARRMGEGWTPTATAPS